MQKIKVLKINDNMNEFINAFIHAGAIGNKLIYKVKVEMVKT